MAKHVSEPQDTEGFDRVFNLIGGNHRYQWTLLCIVALQGVIVPLHSFGYVFLGAVPDHWCEISEFQDSNWTSDQIKSISIPRAPDGLRFENCEYYDLDYSTILSSGSFESALEVVNISAVPRKSCEKWTYDKSIYISTTVTQFDLVCGRKFLVGTIQAMYMAGVFVGSFTLGGLSDGPLGRRNTVLVSIVLLIICALGAAFSSSYMVFIAFRFFMAIGATGTFQNSFTLMMEYTGKSYRAFVGIIQGIPFAIGYMILPAYAYYMREWWHLQLAFGVTSLSFISYFWILPESSRWLVSRGRELEALELLQGIAKRNGKRKPNPAELMSILEECKQENRISERQFGKFNRLWQGFQTVFKSYLNLVRTPELRKRSIILWILYISVTLCYYGVSFDSALLTDNIFLMVFLGGLMEIPGALMVIPLAAKWGRTPTVAIAFLVSGVSMLLSAFMPIEYEAASVVFAMSGKLFISGGFGVIYMLCTELYPTIARATGLAAAVLMGRIGSILAPYVVSELKIVYTYMPSIIFGGVAIFAGLVAFLLPETKSVELMESIKAIEMHNITPKGNQAEHKAFIEKNRE